MERIGDGIIPNVYNVLKIISMSQLRQKTVSTASRFICIGDYRYDPDHLLGSGFESQVYRAQHRLKKHEVALKVVDVEKLGQGINRKLFQSELACLQELKSTPHVLNLHQVIRKEEKIYVVTELCQGDLNDRPLKKVPKEEAWKYLQQVIKGYKYLYDRDIVHRDLKPGNLFFNVKKEIKIGDFGFAAKLSEVRKQNYYNIGSPGYMAPETVRRNEYSPACDIWSIGIIYFELLTGQLPWTAKTEENIEKQLNEAFLKRALRKPEIDEDSKAFLEQVLCFDEFDRMKPEELFEYQLGQDRDTSCEELRVSLNGKVVPSYDLLSKTTADNTCSNWGPQRSRPLRMDNFFSDFSPPKQLMTPKAHPKTFVPLNSTKNQTLQTPKNEPRANSRRNSFNFNFAEGSNSLLPIKSPKTSCLPPREDFKKKRNSFDMSSTNPIPKKQAASTMLAKFKLENYVMAQISLVEKLLALFRHIDLFGFNQKWNSQMNLAKACLKNVLVNILVNNKKEAEYFRKIAGENETECYLNSENFDKHRKLLRKYEMECKGDPVLQKHWSRAREQHLDGAINALLAFLSAIKPNLLDSKRYTLQIAIACCEIVEKLWGLSHPETLQSLGRQECIFTSPRILKRSQTFIRIEQAMSMKPRV